MLMSLIDDTKQATQAQHEHNSWLVDGEDDQEPDEWWYISFL